jgi:CSLREA domain-containing protein
MGIFDARSRLLMLLAAALALAGIGALVGAATAGAETFTVNSTVDAPLTNPSGTSCASTHEGKCTLRAAVQAADNAKGASTIKLPAGSYALTITPGVGGDDPATGDLDVSGSTITISGAGDEATFIAPSAITTRLFSVHEGASLTISGVALTGGYATSGGAIFNEGALTVRHAALKEDGGEDAGGAVAAGVSATSTVIEGSTVEKDTAPSGGAVFVEAGEVNLEGDTFKEDKATAGSGGVLFAEDLAPQSVNVSRSTLTDDQASGNGGALFMSAPEQGYRHGTLTVLDDTFDEDIAGDGGGAIFTHDFNESAAIIRSTFDNDEAKNGNGGAVYEDELPTVAIRESTFEGGGASKGGAIYSGESEPIVTRSTFVFNTAIEGGALFLFNEAQPSIVKASTFTNDGDGEYGGAIYREIGELIVSASTFTGDSAGSGGAIFTTEEQAVVLTNDTLWENSATAGGALRLTYPGTGFVTLLNDTIAHNGFEGGSVNPGASIQSATNTIIAQNQRGDCTGAIPEEADHGGNIDGDGSCFHPDVSSDHLEASVGELKLSAPAPNGGPTETVALGTGSVAIGAGVATCAATDERGVTRPAESCDSGAWEGGEYNVPQPAISPEAATGVGTEAATLNAEINPAGVELTECIFEYGLSGYEASVPCNPNPGAAPSGVETHGEAKGLLPGRTYHFRAVAVNANGAAFGEPREFETASEGTTTTTSSSTTTTTTTSSSTTTTTTTTTTTATSTSTTTTTTSTATTSSTTATAVTTTTTATSTGPTGISGSVVTAAKGKPCVSQRVEPIAWRVLPGSNLRRITVTVNGRLYRTLKAAARFVKVSLVGLPKETVAVRITGVGSGGRRYSHTFTFHTCIPGSGGGGTGVPYLRAA